MTTPEKALGDAIVSRLGDVKLDARAKTAAREFQSTHAKYDVADEAASNKELARRAALAAVGAADETLDGAVSRLADKLIGAGITKRNKAFGGFSDYAVSSLCNLGYAKDRRARLPAARLAEVAYALSRALARVADRRRRCVRGAVRCARVDRSGEDDAQEEASREACAAGRGVRRSGGRAASSRSAVSTLPACSS